MRLCYIWVEGYKAFENQGVNLHPKYWFDYNPDTQELTFEMKSNYLPLFECRPINQITGLIGKNGSGKSTVFEMIMHLFQAVSDTTQGRPVSIEAICQEVRRPFEGDVNREVLFVFELTNGIIPSFPDPGTEVEDQRYLRPHLYQVQSSQFLLLANKTGDYGLPGSTLEATSTQSMAEAVSCIYYNHTIENSSLKLKRYQRSDYQDIYSSPIIMPAVKEGGISAERMENEIARGMVEICCNDLYLKDKARDFCNQEIWVNEPVWITLNGEVDLSLTYSNGDNIVDTALGYLCNMETRIEPKDREHFSNFFVRHRSIKNIGFANAMATLAYIIRASARGSWNIRLGGRNFLKDLILSKERPTADQIMTFVRDLIDSNKTWPLFTNPFLAQLKKAIYFEEHFNDFIDTDIDSMKDFGVMYYKIDDLKRKDGLANFLLELPEWFTLDFSDQKHFGRRLSTLSGGERHALYLLVTINRALLHIKDTRSNPSILLLMDEADLGLHPEWQRKVLNLLHQGLGHEQSIQLIYATHSPFIASDLPHTHLTLMEKNKESGGCEQLRDNTPRTFGANIHELLAKPFFLTSTIGDIAQTTLHEAFRFCQRAQELYLQATSSDLGYETNDESPWLTLAAHLKPFQKMESLDKGNHFFYRDDLKTLGDIAGEPYLRDMLNSHIENLTTILKVMENRS